MEEGSKEGGGKVTSKMVYGLREKKIALDMRGLGRE